MPYHYKYPRPAVTVDIAIVNLIENPWQILLIKRKNHPFKNTWALPGGFVDEFEALEDAAARELFEETGISNLRLKQFKTYGNPNRDPRGHTISIVFYLIVTKPLNIKAGDDAAEAEWFPINKLPELAFDHSKIIEELIEMKLSQ